MTFPSSYTTLSFQQIRLSHVPTTSPTPTKVILLELYRPEKHNAFTEVMAGELERAFNMLSLDDRVKVVVVSGSGRKSFLL